MSLESIMLLTAMIAMLLGFLCVIIAFCSMRGALSDADKLLFGKPRTVNGFIDRVICSSTYSALYLFPFTRRMKRHQRTFEVLDQLPFKRTWPFRLSALGMFFGFICFGLAIALEYFVGSY